MGDSSIEFALVTANDVTLAIEQPQIPDRYKPHISIWLPILTSPYTWIERPPLGTSPRSLAASSR